MVAVTGLFRVLTGRKMTLPPDKGFPLKRTVPETVPLPPQPRATERSSASPPQRRKKHHPRGGWFGVMESLLFRVGETKECGREADSDPGREEKMGLLPAPQTGFARAGCRPLP